MAAQESRFAPRTDRQATVDSPDLVQMLESKTETITGAVASGALTLDDLDRFVTSVERGEVDCCVGTDSVVRIVRSLLSDRRPTWGAMESAGTATGA